MKFDMLPYRGELVTLVDKNKLRMDRYINKANLIIRSTLNLCITSLPRQIRTYTGTWLKYGDELETDVTQSLKRSTTHTMLQCGSVTWQPLRSRSSSCQRH